MSPCLRVAVLSLEPETSASWYVRILAPLAALRQRIEFLLGTCRDGSRVSIDLDVIDKADLILIQRLFPARATWPVIRSIIDSGKRIVYEAEDLLIEPDRTDPDYLRARLCAPYIAELLRAAHAVIVPTAALRQAYSAYTSSIQVLPELLHASLWAQPIREPSVTPTIGFLGQASDIANLALIEDALVDVCARRGNRVRFVFIGCVTPALAALPGVRILPEPLDYPARARVMREAGLDIALVPLRDTAFNRCKGRLRWLEHSAAGAVGIYSDLPGIRESVSPGKTGLLVGSSPEAWTSAIEELVLDPEQGAAIARTAQSEVLSRHTVEAGAQGLAEALEAVAKDPYPSAASEGSIPSSALDS